MTNAVKATDWVTMSELGILFRAAPIFHEKGRSHVPYPGTPGYEQDVERVWTRCGRLVYELPEGGRIDFHLRHIRRSHAASFGRPCRACNKL